VSVKDPLTVTVTLLIAPFVAVSCVMAIVVGVIGGCVIVIVLVLVVYSTVVRMPWTTSVTVDQIVEVVQLVVVV
jgi:hypothetical protein